MASSCSGKPPRQFSHSQVLSIHLDAIYVLWYICTMISESQLLIERVQTGVRMEKRLLKVLKGFAEYHDMSLGDMLEGIVLHAFDGKTPFSAESLKRIHDLKKFYGLDLDSSASHRLTEIKQGTPGKKAPSARRNQREIKRGER
ncbi:MAG: hypothetical protein WAM89_18990 [Terriglobales bacterium]